MMTDDQADTQKRQVFAPCDLLWFLLAPLIIYNAIKYIDHRDSMRLADAEVSKAAQNFADVFEPSFLKRPNYDLALTTLFYLHSVESTLRYPFLTKHASYETMDKLRELEFTSNIDHEPHAAGRTLLPLLSRDHIASFFKHYNKYLEHKKWKKLNIAAIFFLSACCVFLVLYRLKWIDGFWEYFLENVWRPHPKNTPDTEVVPKKEIKYFLWLNEAQDGPYTIEQLTQKIESGEINDTSLCYPWDGSSEGMNQDDNWIQIKDLPNWSGFNPPSED